MTPFPYNDYKKYLADLIKKTGERGTKAALADAAGCQRSFLSQVLNGNVHLTLEHALGVAKYLRLNSAETEYFYCLLGTARSASPILSKFYSEKITALKTKGEDLSRRLEHTAFDMKDLDIAEYYSTWKFAAVHIACTIPSIRTTANLARKLRLEVTEVEQILSKLSAWRLIEQKKSEWTTTKKLMHLPKDHFMTTTNHRNWRNKNLEIMGSRPELGVNYSAVYSMSKEDFEKLKEMIIQFLNQTRTLVEASPEQELVSFCLDCVQI